MRINSFGNYFELARALVVIYLVSLGSFGFLTEAILYHAIGCAAITGIRIILGNQVKTSEAHEAS